MKLHIVLVEPEIPQNTGNIARTCAAIGAKLHLVRPLGFNIDEKQVKRAGLDYWDKLDIEEHDSFKEFLEKYKPEEHDMYFITTKGTHCYSDVDYSKMDEIFVPLKPEEETKLKASTFSLTEKARANLKRRAAEYETSQSQLICQWAESFYD